MTSNSGFLCLKCCEFCRRVLSWFAFVFWSDCATTSLLYQKDDVILAGSRNLQRIPPFHHHGGWQGLQRAPAAHLLGSKAPLQGQRRIITLLIIFWGCSTLCFVRGPKLSVLESFWTPIILWGSSSKYTWLRVNKISWLAYVVVLGLVRWFAVINKGSRPGIDVQNKRINYPWQTGLVRLMHGNGD